MRSPQDIKPARQAQGLSTTPDAREAPGFDWNDLKYFLAVAREGGLSKAALTLDTSASTVSRHVSALEQRLNVRLFVRLSTGYLLTDAGSELFERVAEVERSTHAVARGSSVAAERDKVTGLVRLATADSLGAMVLAPRLGLLRQRHPGLRVELLLGHAQVDLTRREADIALRILDAGDLAAHPDHVMHRVGSVHFHLYATQGLLDAAGVSAGQVDWKSLDHIAWDVSWRHLALAQWMQTAFGRPPVFSSNSIAAHLQMARAGLGVSMLPQYMVRADDALVRLDAGLLPERELWLVYHRDLRDSGRVQAVRAFIDEVVPPLL